MSSQQSVPAKVNSEGETQSAASSAGIRVYPILLILVSVFPMALGIGFTLQTTPVPTTTVDAAEHATPARPNQIHPNPTPASAAMDRLKADELLRAGRYDVALHLYRSLGNADSLRASPDLALRVGMCQEGLGHWDDALLTYRAVASTDHRMMASAAVLGQSRVWMRLNDFARAEGLLRALLLRSGDEPSIAADKLADIAIPYSIVISEQALSQVHLPTCAGLALVSNPIDWSMADALRWADSLPPEMPDEKAKAEGQGVDLPGADINEVTVDESAEEWLAKPLVRTVPRQSIILTLPLALEGAGFKLEWSDAVKDRALAHEMGFAVQGVPLSFLLTAACNEIGARWDFRSADRTIIVTDADTGGQSFETCRRVLSAAKATFHDHQLNGPVTYGLAQLAAADERLEESARLFNSLTRFSTSPLAIRAAFNAALLYRVQDDLERTCQSLDIVVHGAPGNELHTRALILYGQTLIDRGEFREAAFQLKRAANSRHLPDEQARATVFLAMAQLLDHKPADAAESLFLHRFQFQQQTVRDAAALMTSIARWRTADNAAKLREAAFLYRAIVAVDENSDWLGSAGQLLLGQAMRDADLEDRMAELFLDAMQCRIPQVMQTQMQLAMADYWYRRQRVPEAIEIWSSIYAAGGSDSVAAGIRMGEVALEEHRPEICIEICRTLQHHNDPPRATLLKLSGRAHEMAGRPVLAAQCYAGQWPLP